MGRRIMNVARAAQYSVAAGLSIALIIGCSGSDRDSTVADSNPSHAIRTDDDSASGATPNGSETIDCEQYRDRPGEVETPIVIRNELDGPIYVQPAGCQTQEEIISVWRDETKINVYGERGGACSDHNSCQDVQDAAAGSSALPGGDDTCLLDCFYPHMVRIDPGAMLRAGTFRSEFLRNMDGSGLGRMPDDCYGGNTPPDLSPSIECESAIPLQGMYRVAVEGSTELTCDFPDAEGPDAIPCDCVPGDDGTCVTNRGNGGGSRVVAAANMLGGTEETVVLTLSE